MKLFIVFMALLTVFSMFLVYEADMNDFVQAQRLLKMLSEDCAEAGALTIDRKTETISEEEALKAAEEILGASSLFPSGSVRIGSCSVTHGGKGFEVTLVLSRSFFRADYVNVKEISSLSEYLWD